MCQPVGNTLFCQMQRWTPRPHSQRRARTHAPRPPGAPSPPPRRGKPSKGGAGVCGRGGCSGRDDGGGPGAPHGRAAACFTGKEAFSQDPANWSQHNFPVCCAFLNNTVFHSEEQGSVWKTRESRSETRLFSGHSPAAQRFCVLSQVLVLKNPFETEWQQRARLAGSSPLPLGGLLPLRLLPLAAPGSGRRSAGPVLNLTGCTSSSLASFASHRVRSIGTAQVSSCLEMMF